MKWKRPKRRKKTRQKYCKFISLTPYYSSITKVKIDLRKPEDKMEEDTLQQVDELLKEDAKEEAKLEAASSFKQEEVLLVITSLSTTC